jgi:ubiquinone/menaquinone biosynthesis C-methylase UbiE
MNHLLRDQLHHDAIAYEYERVVNEPRRLGNRALFASALAHLPKQRESMLDLGCGTGQMCDRFSQYFKKSTGVDHSIGMLTVARGKTKSQRTSFVHAEVLSYLPKQKESFDLITAVGFLHHLKAEMVKQVLADMAKHLKPGGRVLIAEPMDFDSADEPKLLAWWNQPFRNNFEGYRTHADDPDEAPIPEATLRSWFNEAGLKVVYSRRGWEIFPRFGGGFLDRLLTPALDKFCRRRGVVGLFVLSAS